MCFIATVLALGISQAIDIDVHGISPRSFLNMMTFRITTTSPVVQAIVVYSNSYYILIANAHDTINFIDMLQHRFAFLFDLNTKLS